jgi:hypothetical protein
MKMKKQDLLRLEDVFNEIKRSGDTKFKYTILRNLEILKPFISGLRALEKELKAITEPFEQDRNALIIELGHPNPNGTTSIDVENEDVMAVFRERLNDLIQKHKDELDSYQSQYDDYMTILNEDVEDEIPFKTLTIDQCETVTFTDEQLQLLMDFNIITD